VELSGPDGRSGLRLALRLWSPARFEAVASDPIGRSLWVLEIDGDRGRLRSPREGGACRLDAARPLTLPDLELPLPARELPAVLLGRLPAPAPIRERVVAGERGDLIDAATGERWRIEMAGDALAGWSVGTAGRERLAWRRDGERSLLAVDGGRASLEWRESAREPLAGAPPAWDSRPEPAQECRDAPRP
jgi:hypothetical protein